MTNDVTGVVINGVTGVVTNVVFLVLGTFGDTEASDPETYPLKASNSAESGLPERDGDRGRGMGLLSSP